MIFSIDLVSAGEMTSKRQSHFGQRRARTDGLATYFPIADNFVTQKTQAYCGVASIVMVLNAAGVPAPTTPEYQPFHVFTQDNVLDERTDAVLPREVLARQGMTLDQLGGLFALHSVTIEVKRRDVASNLLSDRFPQIVHDHEPKMNTVSFVLMLAPFGERQLITTLDARHREFGTPIEFSFVGDDSVVGTTPRTLELVAMQGPVP
jgi:hypothetical protein